MKILEWVNVFGCEFPGPAQADNRIWCEPNDYVAIRFTTGPAAENDGAFLQFEASGTFIQPVLAISEVAGNFDTVRECKITQGARRRSMGWSTVINAVKSCPLKTDTTYYLNITFPGATVRCSTNVLVVNNGYV